MKENILLKNTKGDDHGYHEYYLTPYNNQPKLSFRCVYKNGDFIGYDEFHAEQETNFHIR
jgi:hypothetical protein